MALSMEKCCQSQKKSDDGILVYWVILEIWIFSSLKLYFKNLDWKIFNSVGAEIAQVWIIFIKFFIKFILNTYALNNDKLLYTKLYVSQFLLFIVLFIVVVICFTSIYNLFYFLHHPLPPYTHKYIYIYSSNCKLLLKNTKYL